jgi:hypothetical protein
MNKAGKIPLLAFLALVALRAFAQDRTGFPLSIGVSYFGETMSHPGIAFRFDFGVFEYSGYTFSLSGMAGWYVHPRNHDAFFLSGGVRNKLAGPFGLFGDLDLQAGDIAVGPGGKVYSEQGGIVGTELPGRELRFLAMAGIGGGWEFSGLGKISLSPYLRLGAFGEYPFNGYLYPHLFLETGVALDM